MARAANAVVCRSPSRVSLSRACFPAFLISRYQPKPTSPTSVSDSNLAFVAPVRRNTPLLALVIFVVLAISNLGASNFAAAEDPDDHKKLKVLKSEILQLQKQLRHTDDKRNKLNSQLRETELKATQTQSTLANLNQQIASLNNELSELSQRQKELQAQNQQQAKVVSRELEAAYRLGQQEQLKLLFNIENPDHISRLLKYYEYMVDARKTILMDYKLTLEELAGIETSLLEKRATLKDKQGEVIESSEKLAEQLSQRKTLLSKINQQLSRENSRLTTLQLERQQLEKIIAKLEENIQQLSIPNDAPFINQKGKLPWPVQGRIRHGFGSTRNAPLKWSGWLLDARQSSPVKSIHYGRVVFSDYLRGHGLLLIIDHGGGYLSLYAHNQSLLKETGDWVASGEAIAKVGITGGLERSALYFEIRHRGKAVNPKRWLKPKS